MIADDAGNETKRNTEDRTSGAEECASITKSAIIPFRVAPSA